MSEKHKLPHQIGYEKCDSHIQEHQNDMSPEKMLDELWNQLDTMDDISFDPEQMDAYLNQMEQAGCPMPLIDTEASWEEFQKKHQDQISQSGIVFSKAQKTRARSPRYPFMRVAMVAILVFFSCMVVVQAFGFDIFGVIGRWTEKTFRFDSTSAVQPQPDSQNERYLEAIRTALEDCSMSADLAPTWIPKGFMMSEPEVFQSDSGYKIYCNFSNLEGREFSLTYKQYNIPEYLDIATFEKNGAEVEIYSNSSQTFYILSNLESITATWSDGRYCIILSGTISPQEVKQIIDSMGGNEE